MRRNLEIKLILNSKLSATFNDNLGMYTSVIPYREWKVWDSKYYKERDRMENKNIKSREWTVDFSVITVILIRHSMHRHIEDNLVIK